MIKLRLYGTPAEVKELADYLEALSDVQILQRSDGYADRGKSVYVRVYMDVELDKKLIIPYAAENLKRLVKGYIFNNKSDDWADGWSSAIEWCLNRIDDFYGISETERRLQKLADEISVSDKSDVIAEIVAGKRK